MVMHDSTLKTENLHILITMRDVFEKFQDRGMYRYDNFILLVNGLKVSRICDLISDSIFQGLVPRRNRVDSSSQLDETQWTKCSRDPAQDFPDLVSFMLGDCQ